MATGRDVQSLLCNEFGLTQAQRFRALRQGRDNVEFCHRAGGLLQGSENAVQRVQ